ncbi:unnamed protein product [Calypogeia fissa]
MGPPRGRRVKNFVKSKIRGGTGGGGGENTKVDEQLAALGLKVIQVTGDGNCFFRAIADQLEGNEEEHAKYRGKVVDYLEDHKEDFEPFLEEEVTFDEYCSNMRQDGTWAGHMELQATSLVTKCDICIHRLMFPRWQIMNFQTPGTPIIQLSYHGEEHYNSVRRMEDDSSGPPILETVQVEENLVNDLPPAKDEGTGAKKDFREVRLVMAGTGCPDPVRVMQVLNEVHGDTDAAIEYIIAEGNLSDNSDSSTDLISFEGSGTSNEEYLDTSLESQTEMSLLDSDIVVPGAPDGHESHVSRAKNAILHPAQAISRNKRCPCGSKKKYKACCGAIHGRAGVTILTSRAPKAPQVESSLDQDTQQKDTDLGVLCI